MLSSTRAGRSGSSRSLPSVTFINVHKGASTFIADEFSHAVQQAMPDLAVCRLGSELLNGSTYEEMSIPSERQLTTRVYPGDAELLYIDGAKVGDLSGIRLVLVHRDPRDAAVSHYYSVAQSHSLEVRKPEHLLRLRHQLEGLDAQDGIELVAKTALREFRAIRALASRYPDALVTSYEDLVTDYPGWLQQFWTYAGWPSELRSLVAKQTAESFVPPLVADPSVHKRRITPGNWREVFDDRLAAMFEDEVGTLLSDCGYTWD